MLPSGNYRCLMTPAHRMIYGVRRVTASRCFVETAKVFSASASTTSGVYAAVSKTEMLLMWKSLIIIEEDGQ